MAGSPPNMSVFVLIMWPTTWKPGTGGTEWKLKLMIPGRLRLSSITTAICTMLWPICVVSMAASRRIRSSTALLLFFSLRKGPESTGWRRQLQSWGESIVFVISTHHAAYSSFLCVAGFSRTWSWIRWCVLSWSSTLRCRYGTPPAKRHLTNCWMPKSICKYYLFRIHWHVIEQLHCFLAATLPKEL